MAKNLIYYETSEKTFNFHHSIGLIRNDDKFYSQLHKHNCYEILYVISGSVDHYIEGEKYALSTGNVLIINYNELHMLANVSHDYERMVIHISKDFIPPFLSLGVDLFKSFRKREQGRNNVLSPDISEEYGFKEYFLKIKDLCRENTPESEILLKCLMIEILLTLNKVHMTGRAMSSKEPNSAVKDVIKYINDNLTKDLSLDNLASSFFVTKTYLCHIFKKKTGISIVQYITNKRVLLADDYILSGMSATEACHKSGFYNYSNFYKSYTKVMGHSPTGKSVEKRNIKKPKDVIKLNKEDMYV